MIFPEVMELKPLETLEAAGSENLFQLLREQTRQRSEPGDQVSGPQPNANDFTEEPPPEEMNPEPAPGTIEEMQPEPEPIEPINYDVEARSFIAFFDGLQSLTLPVAYQRAIFSKPERQKLKHWKKYGQPEEPTKKEIELISRVNDYKDLIKHIDFSDTEIEMLQEPLMRIMKKYKMRVGPEISLIGTAFIIMAPRFAPLLNKFEKLV